MTTPNISPADTGSLAAAVHRYMQTYMRENVNDMVPAKIVSYDVASNRATIQPLIDMVDTDGKSIRRPPLGDIPVYRLGGGDYAMVINLQPGDFGWLKAVDMDISRTMASASGERSSPPTDRTHSFSNGIFFPDCGFGVTPASGQGMTLQSKSGAQYSGLDGSGQPRMVGETPTIIGSNSLNITSPNTNLSGNATIGGTPSLPSHAATKGMLDAFASDVSSALNTANSAITKAEQAASAGAIQMVAVNSVPDGWIKCNGATVSRTTYAALYAKIGTTYGPGNGSTTFNVPDYRGAFLRGLDEGRGLDAGRAIGTYQDSQNLSHNHGGLTGVDNANHTHTGTTGAPSANHTHTVPVVTGTVGGVAGIAGTAYLPSGVLSTSINTSTISANHVHAFTTGGVSTSHAHGISSDGGSESRPRNYPVIFCIKY